MRLIAVSFSAAVVLALLASSASATRNDMSPMSDPMANTMYACALGKMKLPVARKLSRTKVLLKLVTRNDNGSPRYDIGMFVHIGSSRVQLGMAHPRCWTLGNIKPGTVGHRPPVCGIFDNPISPDGAPCPKAETYRVVIKGAVIRWVMYTIKAIVHQVPNPAPPAAAQQAPAGT
jgi:hypothetical protein